MIRIILDAAGDPNPNHNYPRHGWWLRLTPDSLTLNLFPTGGSTLLALQDKNGASALLWTAAGEEPVMTRGSQAAVALLEAKADPNAAGRDTLTTLHWATRMGQVELTRVLLEHAADPDSPSR